MDFTPVTTNALALLNDSGRNVARQVASASVAVLPSNPTAEDLPVITWRNRRVVLEAQAARKGSRGRSSWIKDFGVFLIELDRNNNRIGTVWCCGRCDEQGAPDFFAMNATTSAQKHLKQVHKIERDDETKEVSTDTDSSRPAKRARNDALIPKIKVDDIRYLSIAFIVSQNLPFSIFEGPYVKEILKHHDPAVFSQIPWSHGSMKNQLDELVQQGRRLVREELRVAPTKIHLGFDLWTSPNLHAILAITGHFIDSRGERQMRLLALREQLGSHEGVNVAETLLKVVREWGIEGKVGAFVCDNASANDTCIASFFGQLDPSMTQEDIEARRLRCFGHILNLVARAFIFGKDFEVFEAEARDQGIVGQYERDLQLWRKKGAVGKLHNIVKFIRSSPQRSQLFCDIARELEDEDDFYLYKESTAELEVIMDNNTRWNSTYLMISRAIKKQGDIQAFIVHLQVNEPKHKQVPEADVLTPDEWKVLAEIQYVLKPFYSMTIRTQGWGKSGRSGYLWEVLTGIEYLLGHLEDWKAFYRAIDPSDASLDSNLFAGSSGRSRRQRPLRFNTASLPDHSRHEYTSLGLPLAATVSRFNGLPSDYQFFLRGSIDLAWNKLNDYYKKCDDSPLFAASVILNPKYGISWLENRWRSQTQLVWLRDAKAAIAQYFDRWYQDLEAEPRPATTASSPRGLLHRFPIAPTQREDDDPFEGFLNEDTQEGREDEADELELFLRAPRVPTDQPVQWWKQQQAYPRLSRFAIDILAIPAMAADCERAFSSAKLALTSQRLSMAPELLESIELMKNWLRHKVLPIRSRGFVVN